MDVCACVCVCVCVYVQKVINVADFPWCNINKTDCFTMPFQLNPCPKEDRRRSDDNTTDLLEDL